MHQLVRLSVALSGLFLMRKYKRTVSVKLEVEGLMQLAGVVVVPCQLCNIYPARVQGWADDVAVHISSAFVLLTSSGSFPISIKALDQFSVICFSLLWCVVEGISRVCVCVFALQDICATFKVDSCETKKNPWMLSLAAGDKPDLQSVTHAGCCNNVLSPSFSLFDFCFKKSFLRSA